MAAEDNVAAALAEFHASRAGVRGLVESGVASLPPIFLAPSCPLPSPPSPETTFVAPTVDISLPPSVIVPLVGAAARMYGFFHVTNHGIDAGAIVSAVRAFHEQPLAIRSTFYTLTPVGSVTYGAIPYPPGQNTAGLQPWRDSLRVSMGPPTPDLGHIPAACGAALLEYQRCLTGFGKKITGLLSEALGVDSERLEREMGVEARLFVGHYYPPCPEPARVVGSMEHTDPSIFTVLAQDGVEGFQALLHDGRWMDVPPVPGALLINIGDVLKLVSNDEYKSVEHRVHIKSSENARVTVTMFFNSANTMFFNSAKRDDSELLGPLPELVTVERPQRYRNFTMAEFLASRREFGHGCSSTDRFRVSNE